MTRISSNCISVARCDERLRGLSSNLCNALKTSRMLLISADKSVMWFGASLRSLSTTVIFTAAVIMPAMEAVMLSGSAIIQKL